MTDNTQPEALRLAEQYDYGDPVAHSNTWKAAVCTELRRQHARIAELESQLESIGAGGVSGPLMGQPQAMPDLSALTERGAKAWAGVDAQGLREGFTAADMATAEARGFRDGVASVAANAGSEPVARVNDDGFIVEIGDLLIAPGQKLYLRPSPPEGMVGGWISVDQRLPKCSRKPDSLGVEVLIWPPHEDGSRTAFYGRRQSREPNFYKYGALLGHVEFWRYPPPPPTSSADSGKGK